MFNKGFRQYKLAMDIYSERIFDVVPRSISQSLLLELLSSKNLINTEQN